MSLPKEGSREIDEGIIVSEAMDWCDSPQEPVGYRIWAKQIDASDLTNSVRQTDDRSHVTGSIVLASYGDEPGVGGEVTSGTTGAECTPKTWSETVRFEGRNAVRHDDEWWMNHKNTWGKLCYVKDQNTYLTQDPQLVQAKMQFSQAQTSTMTDSDPVSIDNGVQKAQWLEPFLRLAPEEGFEEIPGLRPSPRALPRGIPKSAPEENPEPEPPPNPSPGPRRPTDIHRTTKECERQIGRYGTTCTQFDANGNRYQSHHVPPDYTMGTARTGREVDEEGSRFPNMPDFRDMPSICFQGNAGNLGNEHNEIQNRTDSAVKELGQTGETANGTARLGDVIQEAIDVTVADPRVGEQCRAKLEAAAEKAFAGKNPNQLVRTDPANPNNQKSTMDYLMTDPPPEYHGKALPGDVT